MLITEPYVAQNRALHAMRQDYGGGSWRHAGLVKELMREQHCETLLDYGCGKGSLVQQIPGAVGYDPALPEFSERPDPADLVVCTDVLEHIEPDLLDNVLTDLRTLSKRCVYIIVSCRPAAKTLPDGRNAHLIVESQSWWMAKLHRHFKSFSWKVGPDSLTFYGHPLPAEREPPPVDKLFSSHGTPAFAKTAVTFISEQQSIENIRAACALDLPQVEIQEPHERRMVLCAYGPSLRDSLDELRACTDDIVTVSGAHDFLLEHGITPALHMEADAHQHKASFLTQTRPEVAYYLASRCHPDCFEGKQNVTLWHMAHSEDENAEVRKHYPDATLVQGSISVAGRSICLGMVLGYRHFSVYGMDCSFPWDESQPFESQAQHAGRHPNPQDVFRTDPIEGRVFYSTLQLLTTAGHFLQAAMRATTCSYRIHGTGLLATKAKALNVKRIETPDL